MTIYDRPTRYLLADFAKEKLQTGQSFAKSEAQAWFSKHYPKTNPITVAMHVEGMAVNSSQRKHHPNIRPNAGWDLFFKLPDGQFRLWDKNTDPAPRYKVDLENSFADSGATESKPNPDVEPTTESETDRLNGAEFAYEHHLRDYLAKNLSALEAGLHVYQEEEFNGVEFPVGGRFIDILAIDQNDDFVIIELKVSRGYDKTLGQILRYMGWVEKNLADGKKVRGIIVASEITEDLKLATSRIPDVKLMEYEISFKIKPLP